MRRVLLILLLAAMLPAFCPAAPPRTLPEGITVYPNEAGSGVVVVQSTEPGGWLVQGPVPSVMAFWTPVVSKDKLQAIVQGKNGSYNVLFFPKANPSEPKAFPVTIGGVNPVPPGPTPPGPNPPGPTPVPVTGLNVAFIVPKPSIARDLPPDQIALPTSRTIRDWAEKNCEKDDDGKTPCYKVFAGYDPGLCSPRWKTLLSSVPANLKDKPVLAMIAKSGKFYLDAAPANLDGFKKIAADVTGVPFSAPPPVQFKLRDIPDGDWEKYNPPPGPDGQKVVTINGEKRMFGMVPRDYAKQPRGAPLSFYGVNVIPRAEWPARIAALKAANAGLMALTYPIPPYDQDGTNYCWANAPSQGFTAMAYQQGRPLYRISAASVGGPITGYRNVGGFGLDAVKYLMEKGGVDEKLWPNTAIKASYDKLPEVQADRPKNKMTAMLADLGASGKMFDEVATCVLLGAPCPVGYNWWSHEVLAVGLEEKGGKFYLILRNSWGNYEDNGFFLLPEGSGKNKGTPDDAQAILSVQQASFRPIRAIKRLFHRHPDLAMVA